MTTVSDAEMLAYLGAFHETFREAAESQVPGDLRSYLVRLTQMSKGVVGYISTQFGAGYEYLGSDGQTVIKKGSRRVEDLLFDAPRSVRRSGPMISIGGPKSGIGRLTLEGAFPVRLLTNESSVTLRDLRAKVGSWVRDVDYAELFGNRSSQFWSRGEATRRALEEVLTAVVDAREMERRQLDLGDFLKRFRQRRVLLLGDFKDGRARLERLAEQLEGLGYLPLFADEIPDLREQDLRQKIMLLALACRFVLIEDSTKAGQLTEVPLVELVRQVTIILRASGARSSFMTAGVSQTSAVVLEREYDDGTIEAVLAESVRWAEEQLERLGDVFDEQLPWRQP